MKALQKGLTLLLTGQLLLAAGCAANKQMSREEWLQHTSRHYQGVTVDQALTKAEKLFRLADGDDFQFVHTKNKLYATRKWSFYAVIAAGFGSDHWVIEANESGSGVDVQVNVGTTHSAITPVPTANGDMSAGTMPSNAVPPQGNAIYDLFWRRMDYLVGKSDHWTTCREAEDLKNGKEIWGLSEALCNGMNIDDVHPETGKSTYAEYTKGEEESEQGPYFP